MVDYLYSKEEAAELREAIVQDFVKPIVRKAFEKYPQLNSAMLLVAQYWDDNAYDEVHHQIFFSVLEMLDIDAASKTESTYLDPVNLPGLPGQSSIYSLCIDEVEGELEQDQKYLFSWLENSWWNEKMTPVPAFAAFCKEGSHQEMEIDEAYAPYAILHRQRGEIKVEVIGKMLRPWLDGVKPEGWDEWGE